MAHAGLTTTQGDVAVNADDVRSLFGIDGSDVTVGTLSDSYNCLGGAATDVASGDLPAGGTVLADPAKTGIGRGEIDTLTDARDRTLEQGMTVNPLESGISSLAVIAVFWHGNESSAV